MILNFGGACKPIEVPAYFQPGYCRILAKEEAMVHDNTIHELWCYVKFNARQRVHAFEEELLCDAGVAGQYIRLCIKKPAPDFEAIVRHYYVASMDYIFYVLHNTRFPAAEPVIMQNAKTAYNYALNVIKGPWPEAEHVIATDGKLALDYAINVLGGAFPAGEAEIAKDANRAYTYAREVIMAPFPAGEPVIAKNKDLVFHYAANVLKGPFQPGEKMIASSQNMAIKYAVEVLKGPFIAGEYTIAQNPEGSWRRYLKLLDIPFPDIDGMSLTEYSTDWRLKYTRKEKEKRGL